MVTLIASVTVNPLEPDKKYIGDGDDLVVRLSPDLIQFKQYTMGHPLIMGHNTFNGVGPLPGRKIYVLSRKTIEYVGPGQVEFVDKVDFKKLSEIEDLEFIVCGGSQIYEMAMPFADKLRITWIETEPTTDYIGNKFFPDWNKYGNWRMETQLDTVRPLPSKNKIKIDNYRIIDYYRVS